jgi:stage III sporulation protein AE
MRYILVFSALFFVFPLSAAAESTPAQYDISPFLESLDNQELWKVLPEHTQSELKKLNLDEINIEQLKELSPEQIFYYVSSTVKKEIAQPLSKLTQIIGVILLVAFLEGTKTTVEPNKSVAQVFEISSVVLISTAVAQPVLDCITDTVEAIGACSDFILSFLPVYTGVLIAGGQAATASTTHIFLFWFCQVASQFAADILVQLLGFYLAICLAGSAVPVLNLSGIISWVKNAASWALGLMMTLFVGALTISSFVSAGGDNLSTRAARFMLGSFVPVVGGALSEAFSTAQGCLHLLKTTVGMYGVVVSALLFLPVIVRLIVWYFTVNLSSSVSQILGLSKITDLLKGIASSLGLLLALLFCFMLIYKSRLLCYNNDIIM